VNELATNALKHGSLSVVEGQILVQWSMCDGELGLWWRESGGPKVHESPDLNQGSKLIRAIVEGQLRGKMLHRFTSTGLLFSAVVPIA
jgi:two-component sensor histidine kinase